MSGERVASNTNILYPGIMSEDQETGRPALARDLSVLPRDLAAEPVNQFQAVPVPGARPEATRVAPPQSSTEPLPAENSGITLRDPALSTSTRRNFLLGTAAVGVAAVTVAGTSLAAQNPERAKSIFNSPGEFFARLKSKLTGNPKTPESSTSAAPAIPGVTGQTPRLEAGPSMKAAAPGPLDKPMYGNGPVSLGIKDH